MVTKKKVATKKRRVSKKVIEHDSPSMANEPQEDTTPATSNNSSADSSLDLGCVLVISEVETIRSNLLEALKGDHEIIIDGREIQQIDGAGLQLLTAFVQEANKMQISFKWLGASAILCESASQLGLTKILQLDTICKAT